MRTLKTHTLDLTLESVSELNYGAYGVAYVIASNSMLSNAIVIIIIIDFCHASIGLLSKSRQEKDKVKIDAETLKIGINFNTNWRIKFGE